ncbi:MerR family transcriptional regulator [uncultured Methylobacterium sp.]|uniref:MerR family transcriptional regulator n=1 Tax=uncultured Methylobacterium sp. TaxID=157278 RepID=UPI0035CACAEF
MALAAVAVDDRQVRDKRPGAFRTITEVAEDLDVPQHVLRFWETRFSQIRPTKRAGGRRYYRTGDVELVAGIRHLLHVQRYTIEGAQRVLKENGIRFVQAVGRGEAVAAAPVVHETEASGRDGPQAPMGAAAQRRPDAADDPARTALTDVLRDLHACRAALAGLRTVPDA